ncbi:hypothetical protein PQO01_20640 [Lentisphaera marina]|uniref:hypothetical protein n=1 Tax=Lentisphaera marina TaxID=1111041 RepID=UPI002365910A|nr:hypothetical protein [Lentisphaera marina]MDD7987367.1 hypothetical protein [Lentisphaera marina]
MEHNPYQVSESNIDNMASTDRIKGVGVEGEYLVCQHTAILPKRCMITNEELKISDKAIVKKLSWASPWIYLCILLNIIILLIVYFIVRKKLEITYYLKDEVNEQFKKKKNFHLCIAFASLISGIACIALAPPDIQGFGFLGILGFLIFLCVASAKGTHFTIKKFKNGKFYIKGVHPSYLNFIRQQNRV